ncbi:hypothetical protein CKO44_06825 [Rubrivivax gelatinosus]|uniref:hypothetical protein n=1 Tax=Rubrivivax gelatinosus TaxID=28068 RepID=UPI001906E93D|nr:hypothetical protein [Rubrivivax gelatinosus]
MRFTEPRRWLAAAVAAATAAITGCGTKPPAPTPTLPPGAVTPSQATPLPPARDWDEYRRRAAERLVEANPERSYLGPVPEPLLAIPVLEIELEHDGNVRQVRVMRVPSQAKDTTQLAIDAVRRAAPFGDVSKLPRPWKFVEVFLFDDERRFKPRTLDD